MTNGTMASLINEGDIARRKLLEKIEKITKTRVVSYIANPNASPNFMDHNDPIFLNDLFECVGETETLDIIIDSPGGEATVPEKLAIMCREHCTNMRAIIVNSAKSAATMWALTSDTIMMGYLSELGPIDPQIRVFDPSGSYNFVPAQSIIDGIGEAHQMLQQGIDQRVVITLMQKIDPALVDVAQKSINFAKTFAEKWLTQYMLKEKPDVAKEVAQALSDNRLWLTHGKLIGIKEAQDLQLNVEAIPRKSPLWKYLWEYYARSTMKLNSAGSAKLFECKTQGMQFGLGLKGAPQSGQKKL